MKKLALLALVAALATSCSDDETSIPQEDLQLATPALHMKVSTASGESPFTGVLTVMPCQPESSIYFGNYVNHRLTPFYGYYMVKDGEFYESSSNRELLLPMGDYNMIYWGTPKYEEPIYSNPAVREPSYSIGGDLSQQAFSLLKMSNDTTYYPVYDLVHAVQNVNIGTDELVASLQRVVAGIKVSVKNQEGSTLSSNIESVVIGITGIARELDFYTGQPQGDACTVAFPLVQSVDGTEMTNGTVMLFPSYGNPEFQMSIKLKNGTVKRFKQTLKSPLVANTKLTLNLTVGDIFTGDVSGDFTMEDWKEDNENIDVPIIE